MRLSPELIASIDALGLSSPVRDSLLAIADEIRGAYEERLAMTDHVLLNTQRALDVAREALRKIESWDLDTHPDVDDLDRRLGNWCDAPCGKVARETLSRIEQELGK